MNLFLGLLRYALLGGFVLFLLLLVSLLRRDFDA